MSVEPIFGQRHLMPPCTIPDVSEHDVLLDAAALESLKTALSRLTDIRKKLADDIAKNERMIKLIEQALATVGEESNKRPPGPQSRIKPAIAEILKDARGEPMHADAVLAAIRGRGISLSEKDPKATIVTALLRMHRDRLAKAEPEGVEKLGRNMFRWTARPLEPTEPQPLSGLSLPALLASTSQRERVRP